MAGTRQAGTAPQVDTALRVDTAQAEEDTVPLEEVVEVGRNSVEVEDKLHTLVVVGNVLEQVVGSYQVEDKTEVGHHHKYSEEVVVGCHNP